MFEFSSSLKEFSDNWLNFLLASVSGIIHQTLLTLSFSSLDYSLPKFYKHHQFFVNNTWML